MPSYEPFDWYQTPVYYDIIFDADTAQEATFLEQCHTLHAGEQPPPRPAASATADAAGPREAHTQPLCILEPACGSGRLMAEFAARGHRVAGVDLSTDMLGFARKRFKNKGVAGKLVNAPMQDFDLHGFATRRAHTTKRRGSAAPTPAVDAGGFDLAHILVSSYKYLLTEDDAAACLNCVCDHLRVGGVFVLGLHLIDPDDTEPTLERWRAKRDGLDVICTIRASPPDVKQRTEQLRSRVVARALARPNAEPRRYETNWVFRTYTPGQLRSLLRKEPRFKHCATYTFHHDIKKKTTLDGDDLGVVLVLRREA